MPRLIFHTQPETWIRKNRPPTKEPYPCVTAITQADHAATSQPEQTTILNVPENFSTPLLSYWRTYFEGRPPSAIPPRNCLGLVCHMAGVTIGSIAESFAAADVMFHQGIPWDPAEPLPLGEIGIIANPTHGGDWADCLIIHAFVGLGSTAILEVKALGGYGARLPNGNPGLSASLRETGRRCRALGE